VLPRKYVTVIGQSENRDASDASRRSIVRQFNSGQGLENREQQTAEQSHLLSGYGRQRSGPKARDILKRFRRCAPLLVLPFQDLSDQLAPKPLITDVRCFLFQPLGKMG